MYLRSNRRFKDGKPHRYWNIVESKRLAGGKVMQRQVLYLGEINDEQQQSWCRVIEAFDEKTEAPQELALFSADKELPEYAQSYGVQVQLERMELCRPRQYGACWLACHLYEQLGLDEFWRERLADSREGKSWRHVLETLVCYRLIDPGSEWRLHRQWYERSAMGDLLAEDQGVVEKNALYRCLDKVLEHKQALFSHLSDRWRDLFKADFEVMLYDLTSTYFESSPPGDPNDKRRYGHSRDKRGDCVQVVIALIVTVEGFPLAYEVLPGNTSDRTTLRAFLHKIETQYGKAQRIWVMDRGIPTEAVLSEMRQSDPPVYYLVGTPRARLQKFEQDLLKIPWQQVRSGVEVKLLGQDQEFYVLAKSHKRVDKERAMRQRQLKALVQRLKELREMKLNHHQALLLKLGAAKGKYPAAWRLIDISLPKESSDPVSFSFRLNRKKLRAVRRREGHYLLRTNLSAKPPDQLWQLYIQLVEIEAAFKNLKDDLALRPIGHQLPSRIEAHIFVAFMAYCLHVTLRARLRPLASGLTPRAVLDKLSAIQMLDVKFPTTDGRTLVLTRHTEPDIDQKLLLEQLKLTLPPQPPPRISANATRM
jgi:transposase